MTDLNEKLEIGGRVMQKITGGGFTLLTSDPVLVAVVRECERQKQRADALQQQHYADAAKYRTLRRDVTFIRKKLSALRAMEADNE